MACFKRATFWGIHIVSPLIMARALMYLLLLLPGKKQRLDKKANFKKPISQMVLPSFKKIF